MPVVLYDTLTDEKFQTCDLGKYNSSRYEPIGIVAIPEEHDVYGTGEQGIMSLMAANPNIPNSGYHTSINIYWGYASELNELSGFNGINIYEDLNTWDTVITSQEGQLPNDDYPYGGCTFNPFGDQKCWYQNTRYGAIPSPYNKDGSRNDNYYSNDTNNGFSDFSGKNTTEYLYSKSTYYKYSNTPTKNTLTRNHYPAAVCCYKYYTVGTNQGDWYLPSLGEMGYACVRFNKINITIDTIKTYFNKDYYYPNSSTEYLTSTIVTNHKYIYTIYENYNRVYQQSEGNSKCVVIPFTRMKLLKK